MDTQKKSEGQLIEAPVMGRLSFLKYSGYTLAAGTLLMQACKKDDDDDNDPNAINLGEGDIGILNYAYALEQLESAFYTKVLQGTAFNSMSVGEKQVFSDIQKHEKAHVDFFKAALGSSAIQDLEVNFDSINFNDRTSVLSTAKAFEDLGVSAYNGAGQLITNPAYLLIAGKIVSVEARHASAIRSIINPNSASFAGDDVVTTDKGLDVSRTPSEVLNIAKDFLKSKLNASNLPG